MGWGALSFGEDQIKIWWGGRGVDWGEYQFLSILDSSADFTISDTNRDG